ncbi:protein NRT1/ PTR FAMILY 5.6-like [Camellia sinensis]|uniref:protein NRT1/ PTR FAMILY 5.6-like n=1 Tax=Camellia sinensis TaxID=4442 RepID=UPI001036BB63|nr:protein NRT1/ PTR FAMILY 5.6-like [Camellia sinensis]
MVVYVFTNLVTFLTHIWKLKLKHAVAIMNIKGGAEGITGLVEAALIDAYLGYSGMFLITSVLYSIGLGLLVMSVPDQFFSNGVKSCPAREKLCSSKLTTSPFYWGLALIVLAKAGQGICLKALTFGKIKFKRGPPKTKVIKFVWLQFEVRRRQIRDERKRQKNIIQNTYNIVGTASGITLVFVMSIFAPDWSHQFLISAYGTEFNYRDEDQTPQGQDHNQKTPHGPKKRTTLIDHCRWLNNAAINVPCNFCYLPNGWINCTVDEVVEIKLLLRMVPILATFLLYGVIKSNRFANCAVQPLYMIVFERQIERINGRCSAGMKVGLGMLADLACCKVACLLMGIIDGLALYGMEDFFKYQVPESMRKRYALVLTEAVVGWGKILNIGFIMILDMVVMKLIAKDGSWIADTMNQSLLDLFYAALVVVSIANLLIFAYVARCAFKSWRSSISNPQFMKTHLGMSSRTDNDYIQQRLILRYIHEFDLKL